jgi:hypothetical protein
MAGLLRRQRLSSARSGAPASRSECDACGDPITAPAGHGTLVTTRGDAVQHEDMPLCERCAHAIGMTALFRFAEEEEEG